MLTSLLQPQSQPSWATHFLSCHAAVLPSLVYTAPQACKDTSCLTKWHLGVMMESDRLALFPSLPCSRAEGTRCHPWMLPAPVLQSLPRCSGPLSSGTVGCAQVWLPRPQESIGLRWQCPSRGEEGARGTHQGPDCCRCRHTPPAAPSKGEARQASSAPARVYTHGHTYVHTWGARAVAGFPPSQERLGRGSAAPRQDPVRPLHAPSPPVPSPHTRAHTPQMSSHLGTHRVRAVFSAAPGPEERG